MGGACLDGEDFGGKAMTKELVVMLALAGMCAGAYGQASKPAAAASAPAVVETGVLDEALAALKAGDSGKAISLVTQFQKGLSRKGMVTDVNWINSNYVMGMAYVKSGEVEKARPLMDFVSNGGKKNRSTILNVSGFDILGKKTIVRGLNALRTFVAAHPTDEEQLNMYGVAIKDTGEAFPTMDLQTHGADYAKANGALEKTKKGQHHWGERWLSGEEWDKLERSRRVVQEQLDYWKSRLNLPEKELAQAKVDLENAQRIILGEDMAVTRRRAARAPAAKKAVEHWQASVNELKASYAEEQAKMPKPEISAKPTLVEVELVK